MVIAVLAEAERIPSVGISASADNANMIFTVQMPNRKINLQGRDMSQKIECDKCHRDTYADSRGEKYCTMTIDFFGHGTYHLCPVCYRQFITEFMRTMPPEDFDEAYGIRYE